MILVDTSAWLALSDLRDGNHDRALETQRLLAGGSLGRLLTTDYVIDETLTLLRRRVGGLTTRRFFEGIASSRSVHQIWITSEHFRQATERFLAQRETDWSFTDCTSFAVMSELGIDVAFSFDRDFVQAGFQIRPG